MNFTFVDGKIYPVIDHQFAKLLDNIAHFNDRFIHVHIFL